MLSKKNYQIVGVTFENRQEFLSDFYKKYKVGGKYGVLLEREDDNLYDKNAIVVAITDLNSSTLNKVGYISKNDNVELRKKFDNIITARLLSIGPNYKGDIGLTIEVAFEE